MFDGFDDRRIDTGELSIRTRIGGSGPPLLLLHGFPQTHAIWHKIAPRLADHFTVVATDLRGYGGSDKPPGDGEHLTYSKRHMAHDQIAVMKALGFERFQLVGHDRGARVAHRLTLDNPGVVRRLALLDIVPTRTVFDRTNQAIALANWHWFFLAQPNGWPEQLISHDPEGFARKLMTGWAKIPNSLSDVALAEYLSAFSDPAAIHAACEDYRAGAGIDLVHDRADEDARIECPLLVLWGKLGRVETLFDVLACWQEKAEDVRGGAVHSGHHVPEEAPEETFAELLGFLEH